MAYKMGVLCTNCGQAIEVEDGYIPGLQATGMAAAFYQPFTPNPANFANTGWHQRLTCSNPACRKTNEYTGTDLLLYDA